MYVLSRDQISPEGQPQDRARPPAPHIYRCPTAQCLRQSRRNSCSIQYSMWLFGGYSCSQSLHKRSAGGSAVKYNARSHHIGGVSGRHAISVLGPRCVARRTEVERCSLIWKVRSWPARPKLFLRRLIVMRDLRKLGRGEIAAIGEPRLRRLAHMRGERGHPFDQRMEILRVERQQPSLAHRRHRAASLGPVQQRDFPEERSVRKPNAPVRQFDLDLACGDEIHRGRDIAAPHQNLA